MNAKRRTNRRGGTPAMGSGHPGSGADTRAETRPIPAAPGRSNSEPAVSQSTVFEPAVPEPAASPPQPPSQLARKTGPIAVVLAGVVTLYQRTLSPLLPRRCRFYPTCSAYAITALRERGAVIGITLATYRLLRCNPWARGGVDHVPHVGERWPSWDGVVDRRDSVTTPRQAIDPRF